MRVVFIQFLIGLSLVSSGLGDSVPTPKRRCQLYEYYDSGVDNCESCCDLCCNAAHKRTVDRCEAVCSEYAKKLRDEINAQKQQNDAQQLHGQEKTGGSQSTNIPVAAQAGIVAFVCVSSLMLITLLIAKRKAIVRLFHRAPVSDLENPAAVPLNPGQDLPLVEVTTPATAESAVSSQEVGVWSIRSGSAQPASSQASTANGRPETTKVPVQVSREGHYGSKAFALPAIQPIDSADEETELKTIEPSLSTFGAFGGTSMWN